MPLVGVNNEPLLERAIFAYDGTDYRVVKCDATGQIVAALEAGSTIEVTQDTAADLKATVDVAAGQSIEVTQDTAADLKATVDVAAGQSIEVTQDTAADLKATVNLGRANEFGLVQVYYVESNVGAGTQSVSSDAVPSGEVWHITHVTYYITSSTVNAVRIAANGSTNNLRFYVNTSPINNEYIPTQCDLYLTTGDTITLTASNCGATDDLYIYIWGEKVKG